MKSKRDLEATVMEPNTLWKFENVRSSIGNQWSAFAESGGQLGDKVWGAQNTREEEIDQSEGFDGG